MASPSDRRRVTRIVPARAGIVGNPSDGYGGRVVATTIGQLCARVTASAAARSQDTEGDGGALVDAARRIAEDWLAADAAVEVMPTTLSFTTDIPRQVGLAGSSAIVIGVVEALAALHGVDPEPTTVARLALRAETEVLGIAAGPQDRVVQSHRGLLDMDFAQAWNPTGYRRLPDAAARGLVVAWHPEPGAPSSVVHGDLRARWDAGDPDVHEVMDSLAALAGRAGAALRRGDDGLLATIIDEACRLRRRLWTFSSVDEQLLAVADRAGAAGTLAGSGGAIVAVGRHDRADGTHRIGGAGLCAAFEDAGLCAIVPRPQPGPTAECGSAREPGA